MSSTNPQDQPPIDVKEEGASSSTSQEPQEVAMDTTPDQIEESWDDIPDDVLNSTPDEIFTRTRLIDNDIKVCYLILLPKVSTNSGAGDAVRDSTITA